MLDYDSIQWFLVGFVVGVSDCPLTHIAHLVRGSS